MLKDIVIFLKPLPKSILSLGIATTSLYWFLGIGREPFSTIKYGLLLSSFFSYLLIFTIKHRFTLRDTYKLIFNRWWSVIVLSILVFSLCPLYKGESYLSYYFYSRFMAGLMIVLFFYFFTICEKQTMEVLHYSALLVAFVCFLHVVLTMLEIKVTNLSNTPHSFNSIGFGTVAPNWSAGISLFSILLPCYAILQKKTLKIFLLYFFLSANTILYSQILAGGRAGVSATGLMMGLLVVIHFPIKKAIPILFLFIINILIINKISIVYSDYNILRGTPLTKSVLFQPSEIASNYATKNHFLTFNKNSGFNNTTFFSLRDKMTIDAVQMILKKPVTGFGFGKHNFKSLRSGTYEYHNVFLKYGVDGGFLFLVSLFLFATYPIFMYFKEIKPLWRFNYLENTNITNQLSVCCIIIFGGVYNSMFSPRYIYGGVNVSFIWWACYGCFIGTLNVYLDRKFVEREILFTLDEKDIGYCRPNN